MRLSNIISFVAGGAVGTAITFYLSKSYFEKKKDVEISAYKEYYDAKLETPKINKEIINDSESETDDADYESDSKNVIEPSDISSEAKAIREAADYLVKTEIEEEEKAYKKKRGKKEKLKPYLITPEAYNGEDEQQYREDYKHLTLDYYEGDDIVCESSTNQVFGDTGRWLGYIWKNHFGDEELGYDDLSVYIRNDEIKVDYEIVRDEGYYSEEVLGILPDYEDTDGE